MKTILFKEKWFAYCNLSCGGFAFCSTVFRCHYTTDCPVILRHLLHMLFSVQSSCGHFRGWTCIKCLYHSPFWSQWRFFLWTWGLCAFSSPSDFTVSLTWDGWMHFCMFYTDNSVKFMRILVSCHIFSWSSCLDWHTLSRILDSVNLLWIQSVPMRLNMFVISTVCLEASDTELRIPAVSVVILLLGGGISSPAWAFTPARGCWKEKREEDNKQPSWFLTMGSLSRWRPALPWVIQSDTMG